MTTADRTVNPTATRLMSKADFTTRWLDVLQKADADKLAKVYPDDGVFTTPLTFAALTDAFSIQGTSEATDGIGNIIDLALAGDDGSNVPFENLVATDYHVALTSVVRPVGIQINPRTGLPEYIENMEDVGDQADPTSVVDGGGGLIDINVNSVCESGVDFSGRKVIVYMKVPAKGATTEAIAIEELTVAYAAPNNTVQTTSSSLGQSTISTTAADYEVAMIGPTVRKNTDLSVVDGIVYLGFVTGAGSGNPPASFDTTAQRGIDATLSGLNDVLDAFVQNKPIAGDPVFFAGPRKAITTARGKAAACLYTDGLIYVMGGEASGGGDLDDNEAYSTSGDNWTAKTVIPVQSNGGAAIGPRTGCRSVTLGTSIYLMGGEAAGTYYELVQKYDPGTNTWDTARGDLPAVVTGGAVGVIANKIYYAGGEITAILGTDDTHEYDPDLNTWSTVASISTVSATQSSYQGHAVAKSKLYVFGGNQPSGPNLTSKCFVYDPAVNTWAAIAALPDPKDPGATIAGQPMCAEVNGVIHVFGGPLGSQGATNYHLLYNPDTNTYENLGRYNNGAPACMEGAFVADENDVIMLISGRYGRSTTTMESFVSGFDARNIFNAVNHGIGSTTGDFVERGTDASVWSANHPVSGLALDTMSQSYHGQGAVEFEGAIYCSGGFDAANVSDVLEIYHPETNTWTLAASMTFARSKHGFVKHEENRKLYAVMGLDSTGASEEDTIEEYDPDLNTWSTTQAGISLSRFSFLCALVGNDIYWVGGFIGAVEQDDTRAYDLTMGTVTDRALLTVNAADLMGDAIRKREPGGGMDGIGWYIYAFGGRTAGLSTDDMYKYDTVEDIWIANAGGPLLNNRSGGVALPVENPYTGERTFMIVGGEDVAAVGIIDTELFDPDTGVISSIGNIAQAGGRKFCAAAHHHGRVYIIGGDDAIIELDDMEVNSRLAWPIRPILENYSVSRHRGPGARRDAIQRDTVAFKATQIWGWGSWDAEAEGDIIKIGED